MFRCCGGVVCVLVRARVMMMMHLSRGVDSSGVRTQRTHRAALVRSVVCLACVVPGNSLKSIDSDCLSNRLHPSHDQPTFSHLAHKFSPLPPPPPPSNPSPRLPPPRPAITAIALAAGSPHSRVQSMTRWAQHTLGWTALVHAVDCRDYARCVTLLRRDGVGGGGGGGRDNHVDLQQLQLVADTRSHPLAPEPDARVSALVEAVRRPWSPATHRFFPEQSRETARCVLLVRQRVDTVLNAHTVLHNVLQLLLQH